MNITKVSKSLMICVIIYTIISMMAVAYCYETSYETAENAFFVAARLDKIANYSILFWLLIILFTLTRRAHRLMKKTSGLIQYIPYLIVFMGCIMSFISIIFIFTLQSNAVIDYILMTMIGIYAMKFFRYELNHYQPELTKQKIIQYIYYFISFKGILIISSISIRLVDVLIGNMVTHSSIVFVLFAYIVIVDIIGAVLVGLYLLYTKGFHYKIDKI